MDLNASLVSLRSPPGKVVVLLLTKYVLTFSSTCGRTHGALLLLKSKATGIACKTKECQCKQESGFCFRLE